MQTIEVKIIEGGKAREVNPLGDEPIKSFEACHYVSAEHEYKQSLLDWQEAESKLRTFDIVNKGELTEQGLEVYLSGVGEPSKILKSKVKIIAKENVFFDETSNMHTLVPCGGAKVGQVGKSINR